MGIASGNLTSSQFTMVEHGGTGIRFSARDELKRRLLEGDPNAQWRVRIAADDLGAMGELLSRWARVLAGQVSAATATDDADDAHVLFEAYKAEHSAKGARQRRETNTTKAFLKDRGISLINEKILITEMRGWIKQLRDNGDSQGTINRKIREVSAWATWCVGRSDEMGLVMDQNPLINARLTKVVKTAVPRDVYSLDEIRTMREAEGHEHWLYFMVLLYTGCRPGDANRIRGEHVNGDFLDLYDSKDNGRDSAFDRRIRMQPELVAILKDAKLPASGPIFPSLYELDNATGRLSQEAATFWEHVDIPRRANATKLLRHTHISYRFAMPRSEPNRIGDIQADVGHAEGSKVTAKNYRLIVDPQAISHWPQDGWFHFELVSG